MQRLASGSVLGAALSAPAAEMPAHHPGAVNVSDFGATGNGADDDTGAFRKALAAAAGLPAGRSVLVPPGAYRVTSSLHVQSTLLLGAAAGGWPADTRPLPTLVVDVPAPEPCIVAETGASLHGLCFSFLY